MLTMKSKMRCRECMFYNYDFFQRKYDEHTSYCGLHGRRHVDPDGDQMNLLGADRFGCGFVPFEIQLNLFDNV